MNKCKTKNNSHENGITLVALIITIIVLVILAAVSVAAVYNSKIVNYAVNGSIDYTQAAVNENQILKGSVDIIESGIGKIQEIVGDSGNNPVTSTPEESKPPVEPAPPTPPIEGKPIDELAVGAYVSYVPNGSNSYTVDNSKASDDKTDTQELTRHTSTASNNTDWRIWDKPDSTHVRLISTKASTSTLRLHGTNGYNNGVGILNDACSTMYKNTDYATAKSIDMEDIDARKGSAAKQNSTGSGSYTFSSSPKIYDYERNGTVNRSWQGASNTALSWYSGKSTTSYQPTWTYYYYNLADLPNTDSQPYRALLAQQTTNTTSTDNPSTYWVASRCVQFNSYDALFYVFYVNGSIAGAYGLYHSGDDSTNNYSFAARPIVELDLTKCAIGANSGNGTETSPYDIVKK